MYSPTARLLTVLELLQSYSQMSGNEIARRLEVDVRTVRRYITMLQDLGIPIEAERGTHGAYQLGRGYKLPPLMFSDAEAVALTLGLLAMREFQFPVDVAAVEGALAKTERVLPEKLFHQVRSLQEAITFSVPTPPAQLQSDFITLLSRAVRGQQQVVMRYRSWNGEETERQFDPYGVVFLEGYWYVAGFCHLREDLRTFRVDRVVALTETPATFARPQAFDALTHVIDSIAGTPSPYRTCILLKASLDQVRRVISPVLGVMEETTEGVLFYPAATYAEWIAFLLVRFDFPVVVVESERLREHLRILAARAQAIADAPYEPPPSHPAD